MSALDRIRFALIGGDLDARGMVAMAGAVALAVVVLLAFWSLQGVS